MTFWMDLQQEPKYWHLTLSGQLGYAECSQVRMNVDRILMSERRATIVDLGGLDYLDSSGLGVLLAMSREYASDGGRLVLITNDAVNKLLSVARLDRVLATSSSIDEAVRVLDEGTPMPTVGAWNGGHAADI